MSKSNSALSMDKYIKSDRPGKIQAVIRSVNLGINHQKFLNDNNLNLSRIVRDCLDAMIKDSERKLHAK